MRVMSVLRRYGLATLACAVAIAAAIPLEAPVSCLFLAVAASALYGGRGPGILSGVLSALAFDYFFIPPEYNLYLQPSSYLRFGVFLGSIVLIVALIDAKRRVEQAREQIAAKVRESESYLAEAQRLSHTGSLGWDTSTGELYWSQEAYQIIGCDPAVKPSLALLFQQIHPEDRKRVKEVMDRSSRSGADLDFEHRLQMADGAVKHVHVLARAVRERSGKLQYIGAAMDITAIVRADENLRRSETYLAEAQKLSHTASWVWDVGLAGPVYWSAELYRIYRRDAALGPITAEEDRALHSAGDWASLREALEQSVRDRTFLDVEDHLFFPDGEVKHLRLVGHPAIDAAGNVSQLVGTLMDVTAQHEASAALQKALAEVRSSEDQLRRTINTIPALVWSAGPEGAAGFFNERWLGYTGLPAEQVLGWGWMAAIHPDDKSRLTRYWSTTLASGEPGETEARLRRGDGQYRWFLWRVNPLFDESGKVVKWFGTNSDIQDRKQAVEALSASEQNFRSIVDSIPGLVYTSTPAGEIETVNRPILEYTGKSLEDLKHWTDLLHIDERPRVLAEAAHSAKTGRPLNMELRLRRADGVYRWFHTRTLPERDSEGGLVRWYGLVTDIEDRKTAEEALRASQRDLSSIIETIPALVWCAGPEGDLTYVNHRVLEYTGTTLDDLARSGWLDFLHSDDVEPTLRAWSEAVATGRQHDIQYRLRRFDGAFRWFHVRGQPVRDPDGRVTRWYGLLVDIDDRRNMEEALQSTQTRLSRATQIASVGELAASIAHEINQPLAAVVANGHACLRWLSAQPPGLAKAHAAAERIVRDGKDAGEVVRRIRALFKRATVAKVELDLNEVIGEVLSLLTAETSRKRILVETQLEPHLPGVVGDHVQLQQLLFNLLTNGMEAMDPMTDGPKKLLVRSRRNCENSILVEIRDHGVGLQDPDRIFEAFFTTKEKGMGMGLAICRSIVEEHKGRLWAVPGEGQGATFCFSLPAQPGGAA